MITLESPEKFYYTSFLYYVKRLYINKIDLIALEGSQRYNETVGLIA